MPTNYDRPFSEDIIKNYLEQKLYEKRGISKEAYIKRCKELWEETECKEGQMKLLSDGLFDYSDSWKNSDYDDHVLANHLKTKKKEDKLECYCLVFLKWEDGDLKEVSDVENSTKKHDENSEPKERQYLFALFDVLGFKNKHREIGTTKLYQIYKELIDKVTSKDRFSVFQTVKEPEMAWSMISNMPLNHHYFSDTIILWTPFEPSNISAFCARCADIICESIIMGLPLRGAISHGSAILNKDKGIFLGSPIIEAARVERQQNWIGVSFSPSCTEPSFQLPLHPNLFLQNYVTHYKSVDGFNKYISLMTLDWPKRAREMKLEAEIARQLLILKTNAPIDKQEYYEQALSFLNHSKNNDEWYRNYTLVVPKPLETIIKVTLINGDELEGTLPNFKFSDSRFYEQYLLLVPKENIGLFQNLSLGHVSTNIEALSRIMYVIPQKAIARHQLYRVEQRSMTSEIGFNDTPQSSPKMDGYHVFKIGRIKKNVLKKIPKDLTIINNFISRIFIGTKGYEIFIPTLNTIHECLRNLIVVNFMIPEGETWNEEAMIILYQMELHSHLDFINAVDKFYKQVDLSKETKGFFIEFLSDYKKKCETFIDNIEGLLKSYDPHHEVKLAPAIMEKERLHLLGFMAKMLCHLTGNVEKE